MTPVQRIAWLDQMDARAREQKRTFIRGGRTFLVLVVAAVAVWSFIIYEIVTRTR